MKLLLALNRLPGALVGGIGLGLIAVVGLLDYLTGPELSFSIFYVIPVSVIAWYLGGRFGILASVAGALVWLAADLYGGGVYSSATIPYWNATVRFGLFMIIAVVLSSLRVARARQDDMGHFVVHDLRTPLSLVQTSLGVLQEMQDQISQSEVQRIIASSLASCERMGHMISSLLDLARLEAGEMEVNRQKVETRKLLEDAAQQVSALAGENGVNLAVEVAEGSGAVVADYDLTLRVLINLMSNAVKFSPREATVTASARSHEGGMVAIAVSDKGAGISEEWQRKVFDKFAQADVRRAGIATGSGLGLTYCRMAVEAQGGHIWVESGAGEGTTFTFTVSPVSVS